MPTYKIRYDSQLGDDFWLSIIFYFSLSYGVRMQTGKLTKWTYHFRENLDFANIAQNLSSE